KRHLKNQFNPGGGKITLISQYTSFPQAQGHNITNVFRLGNNLRPDIGFLDFFCLDWVGKLRRVIDYNLFSFGGISNKTYVRNCGDDRLLEFSFKALLYNLHVQKTQKSATKSKSKSLGCFQFEGQ